jgi:hypothetical protein
MILKSADDKNRRLKLLEDLQQSAVLDFVQKNGVDEYNLALCGSSKFSK